MDLLFKRYANPFLLLDEMISSCRLLEFVNEFMTINNEEIEDETLWEFYLHKIFDISYLEYKNKYKTPQITVQSQEEKNDFEATVKDSMKILQAFGG